MKLGPSHNVFFDAWPGATGLVPNGTSSPTERFIVDAIPNGGSELGVSKPLVAVNWLGFNGLAGYLDLTSLSAETFTERFSLLFTTYWHSFCNLQALTETEIGLGFANTMPANVMFNQTDVDMQLAGQYYTVRFGYLTVFLVCSCIGLLAGILAVIIKYNTMVPDILGSVSTLTRDNPHTPVPYDGSTLDGVEFARHVIHMPVRFVDVQPNAQVGKIALSTMVTVNDAQRLRPGRLYG
jgi:hypothetical protein